LGGILERKTFYLARATFGGHAQLAQSSLRRLLIAWLRGNFVSNLGYGVL